MGDSSPPPSKRIKTSSTDLTDLSKEDLIKKIQKQDEYVGSLEKKLHLQKGDDSEDKEKSHSSDSSRRENVLVMRLAHKEQEVQDYAAQLSILKKTQDDAAILSLRQTNLDPGVNLLFGKMREELQQTKDKLEQAQSELSAWKFTPDSQNGKKLIARCRTLIAENQDLGKQLSQGKAAQLEAELALQKKYNEELKASQDELNEFVIQLDEEVEGMQSTIQVLQRQLFQAKEDVEKYQRVVEDYEARLSTRSPIEMMEDEDEEDRILRERSFDRSPSPGRLSPDRFSLEQGDNDSATREDEDSGESGDRTREIAFSRDNNSATDEKSLLSDDESKDNSSSTAANVGYKSPGTPTSESMQSNLKSPGTPTEENMEFERTYGSWEGAKQRNNSELVSGDDEWQGRTSPGVQFESSIDLKAVDAEFNDDPDIKAHIISINSPHSIDYVTEEVCVDGGANAHSDDDKDDSAANNNGVEISLMDNSPEERTPGDESAPIGGADVKGQLCDKVEMLAYYSKVGNDADDLAALSADAVNPKLTPSDLNGGVALSTDQDDAADAGCKAKTNHSLPPQNGITDDNIEVDNVD